MIVKNLYEFCTWPTVYWSDFADLDGILISAMNFYILNNSLPSEFSVD